MTYIRNTLLIILYGAFLWLLAFIILAVWQRVQFEPDPYDVNYDGKVDIVDVSAVIGHTTP